MPKDLSDLLAKQDFDQLTFTEQELVLTEMSMEEYSSQREMVIAAQILLKEEAELLQPKPPIAIAAIAGLRKEQKPGIFALFTHKVPAWVAIAACALVLFVFNYSTLFDRAITNENTAVITLVDTVFVEKIITEFREIKPLNDPSRSIKNPPNNVETLIHTPAVNKVDKIAPYSDEMLNAEQVNYTALLQNHSSSSGVSLQNDSLIRLVGSTVF